MVRPPQADLRWHRQTPARFGGACGREGLAVIDFDVVTLSRLQFALTALYHFLFIPLTLGLSMILVIMESTYVMTRKE
jgi:hypothetical protein